MSGSSDLGSELSLRLGSGEAEETEEGMVGFSYKKKSLTIIYNGEMCVCDLTEIQAKAIISTAMQEMKNANELKNHQNYNIYNDKNVTNLCTVLEPIQAPVSSSGLSMRRSLQRFLQKRKTRMSATSPYTQNQYLFS